MESNKSGLIESTALTDIGLVKPTNQDRIFVRAFNPALQFYAVIDGLGGQPGGEEAAETALAALTEFIPTDADDTSRLSQLLLEANQAVIARGDAEPELYNMCATATLLLIAEDQAHWAHIGDCRLYHVHHGHARQVTVDHNLAWELYENGEISEAQRQNHKFNKFLSQCLGEDDIEPDIGTFALTSGDTLLLCTDGIHDMLDFEQIGNIITSEDSLEQQAQSLHTAALQAGGRDNIGLVLLRMSRHG